jgi:hypothetical protein
VGECNYYMKARFEDEAAARDARPRLAALLAEGEQAYRYWQDARQVDDPELSADDFWTEFRERFPLTTGYLGELAGVEDWDDELVGHLGSLVDPVPRQQTPSAQLTQEDDVLLLQLNMIWHFSDLGLLERFCFLVLDAVAVGSVSDETVEDLFTEQTGREMEPGFDPFDAIWV